MKADESDKIVSHLFRKHQAEIRHSAPKHLTEAILKNFSPQSQERISLLSWLSFGSGAFATLMALVMAYQFGRISVNGSGNQILLDEVVSSHVRSLMAEHLSDVVSTDQHTVKPWFEGKIDFGPNVKNFVTEGFPLVGGRLDYIEGRPTAALVYKFNQHFINMFQHPASAAESEEPRLKTVRGYQVYSWSKDGMSYWVVSDVNAADLQNFVHLWL